MMRPYLALICLSMLMPTAQAETLAWWRFEQSFESEVHADQLSLTPAAGNGFSDLVPGSPILAGPDSSLPNKSSFSNELDKGAICARNDVLEQIAQGSSFTIEAFVRLDRTGIDENNEPTFQRIIGDGVNEEPGGWGFMEHEGKLRFFAFQASDGEVVALTSDTAVNDGGWHHVAVIGLRDEDMLTLQLYVDYAAEPRIADMTVDKASGRVIAPIGQPYIIGGYNRFFGQIDELRISSKALSESQFLRASPTQP